MNALTLQPQHDVNRPISLAEYYHAACGASKRTLESPRICYMVLEGKGDLSPEALQAAIRQAADVNPGLRMRLAGKRQKAHWTTAGAVYPGFRVIENCTWDGLSNAGAEFLTSTSIALETGPVVEVIYARGTTQHIILSVHHAAADGMGMLHFFMEIFRALRNEPLLGSNAGFSDVELMRSISQNSWSSSGKGSPLALTGGAQGEECGDVWKRIVLPLSHHKNLTGLVADFIGRYARNYGAGSVRIAMPMDLRRHMRGLVSTMNFTGILHLDIDPEDGIDGFLKKLKRAVKERRDAAFPKGIDWLRYLPLSWIDFVTGRRPSTYRKRKLVETVMMTNFGTIDMGALSCSDFSGENLFSLPVPGNAFIAMYNSGNFTNVIVGMPRVDASNGRLENFCKEITALLTN